MLKPIYMCNAHYIISYVLLSLARKTQLLHVGALNVSTMNMLYGGKQVHLRPWRGLL